MGWASPLAPTTYGYSEPLRQDRAEAMGDGIMPAKRDPPSVGAALRSSNSRWCAQSTPAYPIASDSRSDRVGSDSDPASA